MAAQTLPSRQQSQDLWQRALDGLDENLKSSLNFPQTLKHNVLTKALKSAEEKKELCFRRRWTFKRRGQVVILRDVVEKIIRWLEHFRAVGDAAVQYNPGHASLPWAGIRFLLSVAISDKHIYGSTVEGLEMVSHMITRYAIFENTYAQRTTAASSEMEQALVELYAEILTFIAKSKKYFQTSTALRALKSALQIEEDSQVEKIRIKEAKVSAIAALSDAGVLNDLWQLENPINRLLDQTFVHAKTIEEARYREILHWMSPVKYTKHHRKYTEKRLPGTGEWLLKHQKYLDWKSSSVSSILLLHGVPGSGKSSLISAVIDSFGGLNASNASTAPFPYFYCSRNAAENGCNDPQEVLRSILRQLSRADSSTSTIHNTVLAEYEQREADAKLDGLDIDRLDVQECVRLILDISASNPMTIIIDAVDEIQSSERYQLLDALRQITHASQSVMKILLSSRNDNQILAILKDVAQLRIEATTNRMDIELYVRQSVIDAITHGRLLEGKVNAVLQADLTQALLKFCGEVFLLVELQLNKLYKMSNEDSIREAMGKLPNDTLQGLYNETFQSLHEDKYARDFALNAFTLLLCLREPLSVHAFLEAIARMDAKKPTKLPLDDLLRFCRGLVILDRHLNVFRFVHMSFQDFLETLPEFEQIQTNLLVASSCLNVCMYGVPTDMTQISEPMETFYQYGTVYWIDHTRIVSKQQLNHGLNSLIEDFVFDDDFVEWLDEIAGFSEQMPRHHPLKRAMSTVKNPTGTPLYLASAFGFTNILDRLAENDGFDWSQKSDTGYTALYLACVFGEQRAAAFLINHGSDVNAAGGRFGNPLQAACFEGYLDIAQLLINNRADPEKSGRFTTALEAATMGGNEAITLYILQNAFSIRNQETYARMFQEAAQAGHVQVLQYLEETYRSFYGSASYPEAIKSAIVKGKIRTLERLLEDPSTDLPSNSMSIAVLGRQRDMAFYLLQKGANIEAEGQLGTPLRTAVTMEWEEMVCELLQARANPNTSSPFGDALQAAAIKGHASMTRWLLQEGAGPNNSGGYYGNALQAAAYHGHTDVVKLLLDAGARVDSIGFAKDAFHAAVEGGREQIVRLFLDRGFRFHQPESLPQLPAYMLRSPFKDLLRAASPSHSHGHSREDSNLPWTSSSGSLTESQRSLIKGGDLPPKSYREPKRNMKNYALQAAASKGHASVVRMLLDQWDKSDEELQGHEVGTALEEAASKGHDLVVAEFFRSKWDLTSHLLGAMESAASKKSP